MYSLLFWTLISCKCSQRKRLVCRTAFWVAHFATLLTSKPNLNGNLSHVFCINFFFLRYVMMDAKHVLLTSITENIALPIRYKISVNSKLQAASKEEKDLSCYNIYSCHILKPYWCLTGLYLSLPKKLMWFLYISTIHY